MACLFIGMSLGLQVALTVQFGQRGQCRVDGDEQLAEIRQSARDTTFPPACPGSTMARQNVKNRSNVSVVTSPTVKS